MGLQFTMEDLPDQTIPEDTILRATLTELQRRDFEWQDRKSGETKQGSALEWWWEIQSPDEYKGRKVQGRTNTTLARVGSEPNRFAQWSEALLGREIPIGMNIDSDDLVGLAADITVRHEPDRKDPSKKWARVDEVIGLRTSDAWSEPPF